MAADLSHTLAPGTVLHGKKEYTIEKVLGKGGFGITYLATGVFMDGNIPRKVHYAIKEFYSEAGCSRNAEGKVFCKRGMEADMRAQHQNFIQEAKYLNDIHQEGIVAVNEYFNDNNTTYYCMEYLGDTSLSKYVAQHGGKLCEEEAVQIILCIADAVAFLHSRRMNHQDLKPDNVMMMPIEQGDCKPVLIDFGLCQRYGRFVNTSRSASSLAASHGFSPVEQYAGIEKFTPQVDVYSLGCILFFMLTGHAPCKSTEITEDYITQNLPAGLSLRCQMTLVSSMQKNLEARMASVEEFVKMLNPAVMEQPATSTETVLLSSSAESLEKKHAQPETKASSVSMATLGKIAAAVVCVLAVGAGGYFMGGHSGEASEKVNEQVEEVAEQKENIAGEEENAVETSGEKPAITEQTPAQPGKDAPAEKPESKGGVDLGYAIWTGKVVNGQPHGEGKLRFTTTHQFKGLTMKRGDLIDATFVNGTLESGFLYRGDSITVL